MDFALTHEQSALQTAIVRFAKRELNDGAAERDRTEAFARDLWLRCGEMTLQGLPVPTEYGGLGVDALSTAVALEALGYGCTDGGLVFSICAHLLACVVPIWKFGNEEQRLRYLPRLCNGTLIAVNAMTEPGSGSDAFAMSTRAVRDADGYRISGTKTFASNGPIADVALVFALTDSEKGYHGGITAFIVDAASAGYGVSRAIEKMGLRSSPMSEIVLDSVFVREADVLGGVGGGGRLFAHSMDWERACLFASHIGLMERLLERCVDHARRRTQFGALIGSFQGVAHRLADMKVELEAARLLAYRAAWSLDHSRTAALDASMAKLFVSEKLVRAAMAAVHLHGGYGYMVEFELERALRDAIGSTIYSGTSEMQRNIIARWIGLPRISE